jgi:hypothetical protein
MNCVNHKVISIVISIVVGIVAALYAYDRATDPLPRLQREREEVVVIRAREILKAYVAPVSDLEVVDSVQPDRKVGKVYIAPIDGGWEVSGHYRRNVEDRWHPWLMSVDTSMQLQMLRLRDSDPDLGRLASTDPKFDVAP